MTSPLKQKANLSSRILFICLALLGFIFYACAVQPLPVKYQQGTVVAVWDLENLSPLKVSHPDLSTFLSDRVAETIKNKGY
jgi:hypothetical protein